MPRDTGAITLLMLAAALAVGVLGISERVQSQPTLTLSQNVDAAPALRSTGRNPKSKSASSPFLHRTRRVECRLRSEDHPHE